jgi:hypothetical protein
MILENYYTELDTISSLDTWDLLKQLRPIEGKLDDECEEKIKIERRVLAFSINKGELFPKTVRVDVSGKTNSYPDREKFTESEIDYIKSRLDSVSNTWIRGRYSHLLWNLTKNNQYAKIAISCYLSNIEDIIENPGKRYHKISIFVECLLFLGERYKEDSIEVKEKIIEFLKTDSLPYFVKSHILELALKSKIIKSKELEFVLNDILSWIDLKNGGNFFSNQSVLETAIQLAEKVQKPTKIFYTLLAENQDLIIDQHTDEKDFVRYTSYGDKAKYYKKAGEIAKYEECLKEYTHLKSKFELSHFKIKLPDKETKLLNNYLEFKSELLLSMPIEGILTYFATGDDLLIRNEALDKMTENGFKNSMHHIFSTSVFDINSNHKKTSDEEAKENERFKNYTIQFNLFVFPILIRVFSSGIIKGKINYYSVYKFLEEETWFGQKFPRGIAQREIDEQSTWLSYLAPGLHDYLIQIEWSAIMSKDNVQNYILCIDSLTTKFEGALRDFIRLHGGTTTIEKRGELQEQLLEELLQNKIIVDLFTKEDITLFSYVFTKRGWNIRNNVAHCFYPYSSYSFDKATLVFLCMLKLGKYKLEVTQKNK